MSADRQGWFADTYDEKQGNFTWQPCLQLDGYCPSMPVWFETKYECDVFIRDEILSQGWFPGVDHP